MQRKIIGPTSQIIDRQSNIYDLWKLICNVTKIYNQRHKLKTAKVIFMIYR